ncbi:MAG: prepilin peptidase [Pseudomonas sp.]|uniref:A24 family peptidase n=1 Tax=Pseudomonas abieticivorans TaxID=2931382 RepID=UPI0020C15091|nr:prepilin peptidase [Pseudomonas sp. PIA16]MDE1165757.1 prepilin peptidase [Pseudomonas sp.]
MPSLVLLIWFALCAEQDIRQRQIANVLTLGGAAFALFYLFYSGHTWLGASVEEGGEALAIAMLLTLPGYMTGRLGAADVKLLGALALATDRMHLLGTIVGAGVFCLLWLLARNRLWKLLSQPLRKRLATLAPDASEKPPFAPFLLVGFLTALAWIH